MFFLVLYVRVEALNVRAIAFRDYFCLNEKS
jgi:hypothetical protein